MRSTRVGLRCATCAAALVALAWNSSAPAADEQDFAQIEHGRYMVAAADCAACHTDLPHAGAFAGGRPIQTPFGVVAASNITPDKETGIGSWTDAEFEAAVCEGKRRDGSHLYPAMPYPYYRKMTHADVLAIRAYLQTVPPVHNLVESNRLPFPFSIRASVGLWNAMYFSDEPWKPDPGRPAEWNRGAYLVQGPGALRGLPYAERRSWVAITATGRTRATHCKAGLLPTSPTIRLWGWERGRSPISSPI